MITRSIPPPHGSTYRIINNRMARRMRHGCTGPRPPPSLHSYIGWLRKFHFGNFVIFNFAKFKQAGVYLMLLLNVL